MIVSFFIFLYTYIGNIEVKEKLVPFEIFKERKF